MKKIAKRLWFSVALSIYFAGLLLHDIWAVGEMDNEPWKFWA